jgi:ATP-dependent DNA helicase RecG
MKTIHDIQLFLEKLDIQSADSLEDQDLDFKEWNIRSMNDSVALVIEMAVCMANCGGGTVVFGVNDRKTGQDQAIKGVPPDVDINPMLTNSGWHLTCCG